MVEIHSRKGPEDLISVLSRKSIELNDALKHGVRKNVAIGILCVVVGVLVVALIVVAQS